MNDLQIRALKPGDRKYTRSFKGIVVSVYPTGLKTLSYIVTDNGRRRSVLIGEYPEISLAQAIKIKDAVKQDRKENRSTGQKAPKTFADVYGLWIAKKESEHLAPATLNALKFSADSLVIPLLGNRVIGEITPQLVIAKFGVFEKPYTLRRAVRMVNFILDFAVLSGLIPFNPCLKVIKAFPKPPQAVHRKSIPYSRLTELKPFYQSMKQTPISQAFLLMCLYSLLRANECVCLQWAWISEDAITIPAELMKTRKPHRVPLTDRMRAALEKLPRINEYVFSSKSKAGHLGRDVITKRLEYFKQETTVHGFRAMGRTYFADKGVRFEVAEACLAHQEQSAIVRAYSRTDYFEERKQVMADWNEYVWKCLAEDEDKKAPDRMAGQTL
jgi:integrase